MTVHKEIAKRLEWGYTPYPTGGIAVQRAGENTPEVLQFERDAHALIEHAAAEAAMKGATDAETE